MLFENKKVLVVGLARSGIAVTEYLLKENAKVVISDSKPLRELCDIVENLKKIGNLDFILGRNPNVEEVKEFELAIVSPGVPLDIDYIVEMKKINIEVISEIELAYRASREKKIDFIGITGTNGKTTTTSIMGEILKEAGFETYVVGNIGSPAIKAVLSASKKSVLVTELSSFQLESIVDFKPEVSSVLNLTEDHMNRHHTIRNYAKAKANIFSNQDKSTTCVLNYDDKITRSMGIDNPSKVMYFSRNHELEYGVYLNGEYIVFAKNGKQTKLMKSDEFNIPGGHNLENAMAAIAMSIAYGIKTEIYTKVLKTFKAVEHRLEFVDNVDGVMYVNDSKGTNPDSTIKAVQSYKNPIILIAGGYDKGSDFNELFEIAKENVKSVICIGQTAKLIESTALNHGIKDIIHVESMETAVKKAEEISQKGDVVLLSPACASWGMYNNYEERGNDFKNCVHKIKNER